MNKIINTGIDTFVEIGPKKTLLNFIPKNFEVEKISISNIKDLEIYV